MVKSLVGFPPSPLIPIISEVVSPYKKLISTNLQVGKEILVLN